MWHESARREMGILMGKPQGVKIRGRQRGGWEGNYKVYIKEMRLEGVQWIHLAPAGDKWLEAVNIIIQIRVP
jgi:hypothetical protein